MSAAPYAGVICSACGKVDMTEAEYLRQMQYPGRRWRCPDCGIDADFDDDRFEQLLDQADEVPPR